MLIPDATAFVPAARELLDAAHLNIPTPVLLHLLYLDEAGTLTARPAVPQYITWSDGARGQMMAALTHATALAPDHQALGPVVAAALTYVGEHAQTALGGRTPPPSPLWDAAPHRGLTVAVVDLSGARHRLVHGQEPDLDLVGSDQVLDTLDHLAVCLTAMFPGLPRARRDGLERAPLDPLLANLGMQPGSRAVIDAMLWRRARCADCAVPVGVRHENGCHNGRCVATGEQHISWCAEPDPSQCTQSVFTGYPCGWAEALAYGRRLSLVEGQWRPGPDGVMPDANYVRQHGRWDPAAEHFVLA